MKATCRNSQVWQAARIYWYMGLTTASRRRQTCTHNIKTAYIPWKWFYCQRLFSLRQLQPLAHPPGCTLNLDMKQSGYRTDYTAPTCPSVGVWRGCKETSTVYLLSTVQIPHYSTDDCVSVRDNLRFRDQERKQAECQVTKVTRNCVRKGIEVQKIERMYGDYRSP